MSISDDEITASFEKRRSDRVSMAVQFDVSGIDPFGHRFSERAVTERVSRHGASIVLARALAPEQIVTFRRQSPPLETEARIIGQVGICPTGHIYGITFVRESNFWGIRFAPLAPTENSLLRLILSCCSCSCREVVDLTEIELRVLRANDRLTRQCVHCRQSTLWTHGSISKTPAVHPAVPSEVMATPTPTGDWAVRRRYPRVRGSFLCCVQKPGEEELVRSVDISRGGVRFQSSRKYDHTWIQVSVPFTPGGANIFTPGRIVWSALLSGKEPAHYGVKYVAPSY